MKLMKNKKYLQQKFSRKFIVPQTTADFTSRVSKSYVPFTCKFPMLMYFVSILHRRCRPQTNFYVFSYDKISLKFCASFRFFLAIFMEKFQKICYLSYVRREIDKFSLSSRLLLISQSLKEFIEKKKISDSVKSQESLYQHKILYNLRLACHADSGR